MSGRGGRAVVLLIAVASTLTAAGIAVVLWGRFPLGADDWAWMRATERDAGSAVYSLVMFGLMVALALVAWTRSPRAGRLEQGVVVGLLAVLAFLAQVVVAQQSPAGYQESVIAAALPGPNRYHRAASGIDDLGPVLRDYPRWMRGGSHTLMITHPAGPLTLFWCVNRVYAGNEAGAARFVRWCEDGLGMGLRLRETPWGRRLFGTMREADLAGAWLATFLLRGVACLVVVPAYALARALYDRQTAVAAAALAAVIPSLLLFSPGLDQAYPTVALTACWLACTAGRKRAVWRAALAGLAVSIGMFFTLAFGVVGVLSALLAWAGFQRGERPGTVDDALRLAAGAAVGWVVPVVSLYLAFGYNSLGAWWGAWQANARFNAIQDRTYWTWLVLNPVDFLVFLGLPVACLFIRRTASQVWALRAGRLDGVDWATVVVAGLLVTLTVLGVNRGEVARLWLFLMPLCAVAAAAEIGRYAPYRRVVLAVLLTVQCVQVVAFKAGLDVLLGPYRHLGG